MKKLSLILVLVFIFAIAGNAQVIKAGSKNVKDDNKNLTLEEMQQFKAVEIKDEKKPATTGPVIEIVDSPLCYPSPFSVNRDQEITIQYALNQEADIDIYIFAMNGEIIKRISASSGSEGGLAELNQISWDGKSDAGYLIGNGIYLGTIMERATNKVLSRFTLTAYN